MQGYKGEEMKVNVVVCGVGGQGIITLANILGKAAFLEGYDVKQAEVHGLSQRVGSLQTFVRFGEKVYSPLLMPKEADLVIALEAREALLATKFMSKEKTIVLLNSKVLRNENIEEIIEEIKKHAKEVELIDANKIVKELVGNVSMVNTFMLAYATKKGWLPLSKEAIWKAIEEKIRQQFLEANKKVFEKAFEL
jgi:indolepyruvate ferredoxin oxidoreductase beta subunit